MPSLPFKWFIPSSSSRPASPPYNVVHYDDDDSDIDDRPSTDRDDNLPLNLAPSLVLRSASSQSAHLLLPRLPSYTGSSPFNSAQNSPYPSRPPSPLPTTNGFYTTASSEDEPSSPPYATSSSRRKWGPAWASSGRRRKHHLDAGGLRSVRGWKRTLYKILKHPLFPTQPLTILLTLLLISTFALLLTVSLIYILNPDKYALPWRQYCSHPAASSFPPIDFDQIPPAGLFIGVFSMDAATERRMFIRTTWASHVRSRGMDGATDRTVVRFILGKPRPEWERRVGLEMQAYNDIIVLPVSENMNNGKTHAFFTWAHENALVPPPNTNHTFNPVHRLPAPPKIPIGGIGQDGDTVVLSTTTTSSTSDAAEASETSGSTTTDDKAEAEPEAVPEPHLPDALIPGTNKRKGPAPAVLAPHDPRPEPRALQNLGLMSSKHRKRNHLIQYRQRENWVTPEFVIKADDDSFVMLAELEGRLRVEWAEAMRNPTVVLGKVVDPLIFWGYLVKSRFMAGELYALSWSLVSYIATNPRLASMKRGAEDKTTSKWIRLHPHADKVRWRSEHCWVYDHPRAGTVYSHGFLFPSEQERVRAEVDRAKEVVRNVTLAKAGKATTLGVEVAEWMSDPGLVALSTASSSASGSTSQQDSETTAEPPSLPLPNPSTTWDPDAWVAGPPDPAQTPLPPSSPFLSRSTVSKFGARYAFPSGNLTIPMQVEALVEGSLMSTLTNASDWSLAQRAWDLQETYDERYAPRLRSRPTADTHPDEPDSVRIYGKRGIGLGGTVIVHFIKKNEWFLETAMALLGPSWNGDEGRIDPGSEKSAEEGAKTVIAKTQSFKRKRIVEDVDAEVKAEMEMEPREVGEDAASS